MEEINQNYIKDLTIHYVDTVDQVLETALLPQQVSKPMKFVFPKEKDNEPAVPATVTVL